MSYCDYETGKRRTHQPWAMQVAWNDRVSDFPFPLVKTVGIRTVVMGGITFFTRRGGTNDGPASMTWDCGDYPYERRWHANGYIHPISSYECEFMEVVHPPVPGRLRIVSARVRAENAAAGHVVVDGDDDRSSSSLDWTPPPPLLHRRTTGG
jgi:hypothetical protein